MKFAFVFRTVFAGIAIAALGGCIKSTFDMPDVRSIGYDGAQLVAPDCGALSEPSHMLDAGARRPAVTWGCATYTNLAAQIANPRDLVDPQPIGPADAAVAASAVNRYENGRVTPLDKKTTRDAK
jgi:pilus biogenesis lipoprotein CpaD